MDGIILTLDSTIRSHHKKDIKDFEEIAKVIIGDVQKIEKELSEQTENGEVKKGEEK